MKNSDIFDVLSKIEEKCDSLVTIELNKNNFFEGTLRAALAKNFEFMIVCHKLEDKDASFFFTPSLRGICEDLIALKFIDKHIKIDTNKLMQVMTAKTSIEGSIIQESFINQHRPHQSIVKVVESESKVSSCEDMIKAVLTKNRLNSAKDFPSVAHMATDSNLIKLYNYLYYATSKTVHFEPGLLMKLGWTTKKGSKEYKFSTKNFQQYYNNFNTYYSTYLFLEFYKSFKKNLGLDKVLKKETKRLREYLDETIRVPEIVTFEELNLKPPSIITQILMHAAASKYEPNTP